jgi:predicted metal-dependent hydrolase
MATAARPLRRSTATRLVADLIERARAVNSDDSWAYRVWMVAVFGSYVRGAARRIWLNLELAKKPVQCIEYVMVHELIHLLERDHSDRFVAIMDRNLPPWRVLRQELNAAPLAHETWSY